MLYSALDGVSGSAGHAVIEDRFNRGNQKPRVSAGAFGVDSCLSPFPTLQWRVGGALGVVDHVTNICVAVTSFTSPCTKSSL
jgi:hypothetical protein